MVIRIILKRNYFKNCNEGIKKNKCLIVNKYNTKY